VWYEHHLPGCTYRMTEMQATLLQSQLCRLDEQTLRRDANGRYLDDCLGRIRGLSPMRRDSRQQLHSHHLYMIRYDGAEFGLPRARFLAALAAEGVPCGGGYAIPLHHQPLFTGRGVRGLAEGATMPHLASYDYTAVSCPNAERACSEEAIWISQYVLLADTHDMQDIVSAVEKIRAAVPA
jgi:dTDP-4-amino-4,6-dideoxygalactose transaminase